MSILSNGKLTITPADPPPFDIMRMARVEFLVKDLAASKRWYVDTMGFFLTEETPDALYLRSAEDRHHHCIALRRTDGEPRLGALGFRVRSEEDLDLAERWYTAKGCPTKWETAIDGSGARELRTIDPLGFPVLLYCEQAPTPKLMLQQYHEHKGARALRIDHFNIMVPDVEGALPHWFELGFRCSEIIHTPDERIVGAWTFRKPDVHDVSFTTSHGPRLHHVGFYVPDGNAILQACDALAAAGYSEGIERGPGRHGVSAAYFVYLRDPDGHRVELVTYDYYTGDPDLEPILWSTTNPMRRTYWGHHVPDSWYTEGSQPVDLDGNDIELIEPVRDERLATTT